MPAVVWPSANPASVSAPATTWHPRAVPASVRALPVREVRTQRSPARTWCRLDNSYPPASSQQSVVPAAAAPAAPTDAAFDAVVRARVRCPAYVAAATAVTRGTVATRLPVPGFGRVFVHMGMRQLVPIINAHLRNVAKNTSTRPGPGLLHWPTYEDAVKAANVPGWAGMDAKERARQVAPLLAAMRRTASAEVAACLLQRPLRLPRGGELDSVAGDGVSGMC
jgi:hypothetical protein